MNAQTTIEFTEEPDLVSGWTEHRKVRFLAHLAEHGNVRAAASVVGLSRASAYLLRRRDPQFARGWAAALVLAHDEGTVVLADRAIEGAEEEVWYRGELKGTRRKYDSRLLLAHLARLDKALEDEAAVKDAGRFDELLACVGGEDVPPDLQKRGDILPMEREQAGCEFAAYADEQLREETLAATGKGPDDDTAIAVFREGRAEGLRRWDLHFRDACSLVDAFVEWDGVTDYDPDPVPEETRAAITRACTPEGEVSFSARTVSTVSSTVLAASLLAQHGTRPAPLLHFPPHPAATAQPPHKAFIPSPPRRATHPRPRSRRKRA